MKMLKQFVTLFALVAGLATAHAADSKTEKIDKAPKAKYPLDLCLVSDEKLGDMGDPFKFKHKGKEVQLCCKSCKKDFDKNPDKFMKKLAEAEKKAAKKKL